MNSLCGTVIGLVLLVGDGTQTAQRSEATVSSRFVYERYDARSGCLYRSRGSNADYDESIRSVCVDSKERLWVGTTTGLAVSEQGQWRTRTFRISAGWAGTAILRALRLSECGPDNIVEGPSGTVWLGGPFRLWRFRDSSYEEITSRSDIASMLAMAVDQTGQLWVVQKWRVCIYDGTISLLKNV